MTRTEHLSDLLNELYQLPLNPEAWPCMLQRLLGWVGGCATVLLCRQRSAAAGPACLTERYCAGAMLNWAALEDAPSEPLASWAQRARGLAAGALLALSDLYGASGAGAPGVILGDTDGRLMRSGLAAPGDVPTGDVPTGDVPTGDVLVGDVLTAVIERDSDGHGVELLIARDLKQGYWDRATRAPLILLMPHLQRVLRLSAALIRAGDGAGGLLQRAQSAARRYEFTPAEARVLEALLGGRTVGSVARTLGVGEATVKTHLQHIFDKTDTRRQIDLVRLLSDPERRGVRLS